MKRIAIIGSGPAILIVCIILLLALLYQYLPEQLQQTMFWLGGFILLAMIITLLGIILIVLILPKDMNRTIKLAILLSCYVAATFLVSLYALSLFQAILIAIAVSIVITCYGMIVKRMLERT